MVVCLDTHNRAAQDFHLLPQIERAATFNTTVGIQILRCDITRRSIRLANALSIRTAWLPRLQRY